jgi:hypothetical protein
LAIDNNIYILPKGAPPVPKAAIAAIVILVVGVIAMVVYIRSKPASSQVAVPGQELIIGVDRVTLYVPKDAAVLDGVISISSLTSNIYSIAGEESTWFRSQVVDVQYLDRQGVPYIDVTFPQPVSVCFMIKERWDDYIQHPDEYLVQYYAEEQTPPVWVTLPMSAMADRFQLCGQTEHLSIFALAVKPPKEIPITGETLIPTLVSSPTPTSVGTPGPGSTPTSSDHDAPAPAPASTRAATDVPPTSIPPTSIPPTSIPPTAVPPTAVPPTAVPPTNIPPTEPPATEPPATEPPATEPPDPDPTEPPDPDPTEPPAPTDPPAVEP